ncbi:helix-turn-helix domain-containing protein [Paenibacillus thiaminolyticus]|uniref:BglG family transcription antiterminator n=1 Tax=Paenibacillus thiaminolyticus TaxID=49283 RepID=UPI0035A5B7C7
MKAAPNRLIKLCQYLVDHEEWITTQELAVKMDCSAKTVRKDLELLKSLLPENWFIISQRGKGICLHRPDNSPPLNLEHMINKTDKVQNLLNFLIQNDSGCSLVEVSRALFYSVSTVSKLLKIVRTELKKYHLRLDMKPLKINGEEFHLRQFYYDYYASKKSTDWIQKESLDSMHFFMKNIENEGDFTFSDNTYMQLPIMLSLWQTRMVKKKYISEFVFPDLLAELGEPIDWLFPLIEGYLASLHITYPPHELYYGAALILGASRIAHNHPRKIIVDHQWDTVANSIRYVEEQTRLPFSQDHILLQQIHEYCLSARVRWVTRVHNYVNLHSEVIKSREPFLYQSVQEAVQLYSKYADSIRDDDIADLTMYFVASRKGHHLQLKEKTILLYMSDPGVMRYAMLKLLDHLNGHIKIVTTNQAQEMAHLAAQHYVDVIITTYKHNDALITNEVPVIQVSPLLSNYEINMIKDTLQL